MMIRSLAVFLTSLMLPVSLHAAEPASLEKNTMVILFFMLLLFLAIAVFFIIRQGVKTYRMRKTDKPGKESRIEFMVSTFHELVQKLKEKEKELQELRERAESRAESIESFNENILQSVPSGVISFDREYTITSINSSAQRILGISSDTCLGKDYQEIFSHQISELIAANEPIERVEVLYETPSNKRIWLGLNISPLIDTEGNQIGTIMVFTDLTDLKAMESQVKLRENLSTLGEMSAGIAHELRNPMGVIAGYTKILSKQVPAELRKSVASIDKEIRMMDRIISDFMSFAHPITLNKTRFDISPMLEDIVGIMVPGENKIATRLSLTKCTLEGDEMLLRQVFANLVQNAVDAMSDGGDLTVRSEKQDSQLTIHVIDTGHGISDELKEKVFLPFYTTKEKGTGLGLSIVHKIVVSHGGSITFMSSPEGTDFSVTLPCRS